MTKLDRLALIRSRFAAVCKTALPGILSISDREICDAVAEETAPTLRESDDETREEAEIGFCAKLKEAFDRVREAREKEEEILLNRAEKEQLARDLREYKKRFWLASPSTLSRPTL